ncbi:uncharacterized protein [Branchiostoma lanceolatum]|uniref:uncharacterized protein n=1 Tax=Branchiostoma lanceolatum TaxID=7740 RepID=UPI003455C732
MAIRHIMALSVVVLAAFIAEGDAASIKVAGKRLESEDSKVNEKALQDARAAKNIVGPKSYDAFDKDMARETDLRQKEIANGRLAMNAITGMFFQDDYDFDSTFKESRDVDAAIKELGKWLEYERQAEQLSGMKAEIKIALDQMEQKRQEFISRCTYKVLKQVPGLLKRQVPKQLHPDTGICKTGMSIMNSFIYDIFEKIADEASKLVRYNKKATLSTREIQTAVRLLLPGELAKHAVSEGTKAVTKFTSSK